MWSVSLLPTLLVLACYSLEAYARPLASVLHLRSQSEDQSDVPTWAIAVIAVIGGVAVITITWILASCCCCGNKDEEHRKSGSCSNCNCGNSYCCFVGDCGGCDCGGCDCGGC